MSGLSYNHLIFFDLETTDFDKEEGEIAQIAAYDTLRRESFEVKTFFNLKTAKQEALDTFHFDKRVWRKEAVKMSTALQMFCDFIQEGAWIQKVSKKTRPYEVAVLAGYRIDRFDVPFLLHHLEARGMWAPFELRVYDVMQLALWVCPGLQDYTLSGICNHLDVPLTKAHDALHDVMATKRVAERLLTEIWDEDGLPEFMRGDPSR